MTRLDDLLDFGQLLKAFGEIIILPKSPTFLGNFCKGVKIFNFWSTFIDIWRLFIDHTEFKANKASFDTLNDSFGVGKRRSIKEIIKRQM